MVVTSTISDHYDWYVYLRRTVNMVWDIKENRDRLRRQYAKNGHRHIIYTDEKQTFTVEEKRDRKRFYARSFREAAEKIQKTKSYILHGCFGVSVCTV